MNQNHYTVTFKNGKTVFSTAFNESDAVILAQAVMIKNGMERIVETIRKSTNISDKADTDFIA